MGGWGCPYEVRCYCRRLKRDCDPGIPGCVLYGRIEGKARPPKRPAPHRRRTPQEMLAERRRQRLRDGAG